MKLKYYLRGLGIGIVVTGILLSIAGGNKSETVTNVEIIQKAQELGMVTKDDYDLVKKDLADANANIDDLKSQLEGTTANQPADGEESVDTSNTDATKENETKTDAQEPNSTEDATKEEAATDTTNANNVTTNETNIEGSTSVSTKVTFSITPGMGSESVASLLQQKGIIDSASDFNHYIVDSGNENNLKVGEFEVTSGESYDQILSKITSSN